jgi:hypothetical protein
MIIMHSAVLLVASGLSIEDSNYDMDLHTALQTCVWLGQPNSQKQIARLKSLHDGAVRTFHTLFGVEFLAGYKSDSLSAAQQACLRQLILEASAGNGA